MYTQTRPRGKKFFVLNLTEHEISTFVKIKLLKNWIFLALKLGWYIYPANAC